MRGRWLLLVAVVAAVVVIALPAESAAIRPVNVATARAEGRGQMWARGRGEHHYHLQGVGKLVVRNRLQNRVTSTGQGQRIVDGGTLVFVNFTGTVSVKGAKLSTHFGAGPVKFSGEGLGSVTLAGTGKYWSSGKGPFDWSPYGTTIALGEVPAPDADEEDDGTDDTLYEVETTAAVAEMVTFPSYNAWALAYPAAAAALARAKNFYEWARLYPDAANALFGYPTWTAWLTKHRRLGVFINKHHAYVVWAKAYPGFVTYLKHPFAYHHWLATHPKAAAAIKTDKSFAVWAKHHPAAAKALHRRRVVPKPIRPIRPIRPRRR